MSESTDFRPLFGHYYLQGYLQGAVRPRNTSGAGYGHDPKTLLHKAGIATEYYDNSKATITGEQLFKLLLTIVEALDDIYLGFLNEPGKRAMDREVGRVILRSETLGEAMRKVVEFIMAIRNDMHRVCGEDKQHGRYFIEYGYAGIERELDAHLFYFYRLAWNYRAYSWFIGKRIKLTDIHFTGARPVQGIDYEHYFGCPVHFEQTANRLCFDAGYLSCPIIRSEADMLRGDMVNHYPDWHTIPGTEESMSNQVEHVVRTLYKENRAIPPLDTIAGIIGLSARSLRRKLARENSPWQAIKIKVRRELAVALLLDSDKPVAAIAEQVGFAEPGDFTRAFSNWTGYTPSVYRQCSRKNVSAGGE